MLKCEKEMMLFGLNPEERSYRGLILFLCAYIGAMLFAAILTVPIHSFVEWIHSVCPSDTTEYLLRKRIRVYFNRLTYLPILIAIPYLLKTCGLLSTKTLGLTFDRRSLKIFCSFAIAGISIASIIFGLQYFVGISILEDGKSFGKICSVVIGAFFGAFIVALLEEVIMRGLIMRSIYTALGSLSGILLSSLFFAYKHFGVPREVWKNLPQEITSSWDAGFLIAWLDTTGIAYSFSIPKFLGLLLFGIFLCIVYIRTKSLWSSIGFHFGIVFCMMIYRKLFYATDSSLRIFFGSGATDGYLSSIVMVIAICLAIFIPIEKKQ